MGWFVMNNDNMFKRYCVEYMECSAVLNSLRQASDVDIRSMHYVLKRMDALEELMYKYLENKRRR